MLYVCITFAELKRLDILGGDKLLVKIYKLDRL